MALGRIYNASCLGILVDGILPMRLPIYNRRKMTISAKQREVAKPEVWSDGLLTLMARK